jgi:hypothetical protein
MATSGRGSGVVGYNVQVAVDTEHHLIVTHEVKRATMSQDVRNFFLATGATNDVLEARHPESGL